MFDFWLKPLSWRFFVTPNKKSVFVNIFIAAICPRVHHRTLMLNQKQFSICSSLGFSYFLKAFTFHVVAIQLATGWFVGPSQFQQSLCAQVSLSKDTVQVNLLLFMLTFSRDNVKLAEIGTMQYWLPSVWHSLIFFTVVSIRLEHTSATSSRMTWQLHDSMIQQPRCVLECLRGCVFREESTRQYIHVRERDYVCDSLDYPSLSLSLTDRCDTTNQSVCMCLCVCRWTHCRCRCSLSCFIAGAHIK